MDNEYTHVALETVHDDTVKFLKALGTFFDKKKSHSLKLSTNNIALGSLQRRCFVKIRALLTDRKKSE